MTGVEPKPLPNLARVAQAFALAGRFQSGAAHGSGHINDTFVVTLDDSGRPVRYILQRINDHVFRNVPALMENVGRVTAHARRRKRGSGAYQAILNPGLIDRKRAAEEKLRSTLLDAERAKVEGAYQRIASAQRVIAEKALPYQLLETTAGFPSRYFQIARTLVRAAAERPKPNGERLPEFRDSNLESLEFELFSEEPLYDDFEQM